MGDCHRCPVAAVLSAKSHAGPRSVAIVGPPNAGKSTLFNRLTGLRQKVANFPGVTVEEHVGRVTLEGGGEVDLIDLPGIYSLEPRSEDEQVTRDVLMGQSAVRARPEAVILILDSTNLGRHLMLAAPILGLGLPTLVVLNMADDLASRGGKVDDVALSEQLGAPVALISASRGEGIEAIWKFLSERVAQPSPVDLPLLNNVPHCRLWAQRVGDNAAYHPPAPPLWTTRLDAVFLHPVVGPAVFFAVILAVFQAIFTGATPLMDGVHDLIAWSGTLVGALIPNGALRSLVVDGVWAGVGAVVVFLPQILLLFLFLGILEDSGYLARAALIADRTMARVGLQGKSFIPLLSAYACAVPAILATRTIENKRDRIATILIAPFMTCSARLPVYTLIIAAFVPDKHILGPFLGARAAALLGLYLLGFTAAFITAKVLKSSILKSQRNSFVMEMPPYRMPTLRSLALRLYDRSKIFLRRAGTIILWVSIAIWCLAHLPLDHGHVPPIEKSLAGTMGRTIEPAIQPLGFNWKIGVGLITSLAAREVIISTLGTIYGIEGESHGTGLQAAIQRDLNLAGAVALMVFFAFAMQCMSTIAVVRKETGGWRWPIAQFLYMTGLAYSSAWVAHSVIMRFYM
ncbi:MAG: ferrous iron transport protein B [Bryobacterales bacterium]|nr:ferrous iron transport protein B [Bryobacterales bacterium]